MAAPVEVLGDCPPWAQSLIDRYWGRSEQDSPAIEHTHEGKTHHFLPPSFQYNKSVLIREQYCIIERHISEMLASNTQPGLLIAGSPGTGKSYCLPFLGVQFLRRRTQILFLNGQGDPVLFTQGRAGFVTISQLQLLDLGEENDPILVLHDSWNTDAIHHWFNFEGPRLYVVLASSPQLQRFKAWQRTTTPFCMVMPPVSRIELQVILSYSPNLSGVSQACYSLLEMYDLLGPSLKTINRNACLLMKKTEDVYADLNHFLLPIRQLTQDTPASKWKTLGNVLGDWSEVGSEGYHRTFTMVPKKRGEGQSESVLFNIWPMFDLVIQSAVILRTFAAQARESSFREQLDWASHFETAPEVKGALFQTMALRTLSFTDKPSLIKYASGLPDSLIPARLPPASALLDLRVRPRSGLLHVAPGFAATFDGLYYPKGSSTVFLFQMTVGKKHDIDDSGLQAIWDAFGSERECKDFKVIFVVPTTEDGERLLVTLADGHMAARTQGGPKNISVKVGYLVIDYTFPIFEELIRGQLAGVEDPQEDEDEFDDAVAAPIKRRRRRTVVNLNRPVQGLPPKTRRLDNEAVIPRRRTRSKVQLDPRISAVTPMIPLTTE